MSNPTELPDLYTVISFLLGEGALDGSYFGDSDTKKPRKRYWWREHLRAARRAQPEGEAPQADWISAVVRDVAELPDRDSPPGREDMMLVTVNELHNIIERHTPTASLSPLCGAQPAESGKEAEDVLINWENDPDSIPSSIVNECRNAICREFGNNGTDGYYKRILKRVFAAVTACQPTHVLSVAQSDDELHGVVMGVIKNHRMVRMFEVDDDGSLGNSYPLVDRLCLEDGADTESGEVEADSLAWAIVDALQVKRAAQLDGGQEGSESNG